MELWTTGVFARAARLTPKALRLYDESGLLPPAAVNPDSGYRLYDPRQLQKAELIASLRRIGMPLTEIGGVCDLAPAEAAAAVSAYWQRVSGDNAARGRLADLLVRHLSGTGASMTNTTITLRHATGCHTGAGRDSNEDAVYASDLLLAVADGARGPGGAAASAAAIGALKPLEQARVPAAELLTTLARTLTDVDRSVRETAGPEHQPVTTLTALVRRGSRLALVHIGDTRAYLLRGGELFQLTQDHTWIQAQIDAGKLHADQAAAHPQRALLVRALGTGGPEVDADLALRTALPGDRYLLCSDGLSAVVDRAALHTALSTAGDPDQTVNHLIDLAHAGGSPDNVSCVVADVIEPPPCTAGP